MLLALPVPVHADEPARYNFASAQGDKELKIPPGQEGKGYIYFYNIDGNRITHITLEVGQAPSGWDVIITPPLSETQVIVSGLPVTVTENLFIEPSELLTGEPQNIPEGMVSIKVPGRGYALGKVAEIIFKVPESAPLGNTGAIVIAAEAAWLGQTGAAAVKQARDFDFSVTIVSESTEYTETVVGKVEKTDTAKSGVTQPEKPEVVTPTPSPPGESGGFSALFIAIIAGVVVIMGAIIVFLLIRRRR